MRIHMLEQLGQAQAREIEMYKRLERTWNQIGQTTAATAAISAPPANPASVPIAAPSSDHASQLVLPSLYSLKQSPNTKWYTKQSFLDAVKARHTAKHPVSLSAYLEDENGQPIGSHIKTEVFSTAQAIWHEFLQQNNAPKNLSKASFYQSNYFRFVLGNKFPFLLYAESYWKVDRVWSTQYYSWYNCHVKLNKQPLAVNASLIISLTTSTTPTTTITIMAATTMATIATMIATIAVLFPFLQRLQNLR
ncbi:hypothetical protein BDZ89DRAFT_228725 [Hymenopellis radicata]|nr:hypothetical protein BDZ89DRAFT_228725 [Hymenopellis radicata]